MSLTFWTSDPATVSAFRAADHAYQAWAAAAAAFARAVVPGGQPRVQEVGGRAYVVAVAGFPWQPVPPGWRYEQTMQALVPHRTSPGGRWAAEAMDRVCCAPDRLAALLGMPHHQVVDTRIVYPRPALFGPRALAVTWDCQVRDPIGHQWSPLPPVTVPDDSTAGEQ